eukprot:CAMPEP_0198130076 /NCGR_PEP_ID=MMETSP1442-20131203/53086_1 /TAXON_ID= /ORGANISM="Craspedostauros australis, Strain CCMP3328" /LENGTH=327 /DNA_ID=CAMNT_0043790599 /DNA_START=24 /DNA_END=1007 /DNA_ORIENTATION=+
MTFAGGPSSRHGMPSCECDECDYYVLKRGQPSDGSQHLRSLDVPQYVLDTLQKHKRQRLETLPLKRTQHRVLLHRSRKLAVWSWTLPLHAEPFIEFGSGHRLVWIEHVPPGAAIQRIGTGIIGSEHEEKGRCVLQEWQQGTVHFIASNGGKAVGFVHVRSKHHHEFANTTTGASASASNGAKMQEEKEDSVLVEQGTSKVSSSTGVATENDTNNRDMGSKGHVLLRIIKVPTEFVDEAPVSSKTTGPVVKSTTTSSLDDPEWIDAFRMLVKTYSQSCTSQSLHEGHSNKDGSTRKNKSQPAFASVPLSKQHADTIIRDLGRLPSTLT